MGSGAVLVWPVLPPDQGPGDYSLLAAPLTTGLMTTGQLCVTTTFTIKLLFLVSSRCNILCLSKEILKVWICRREDPVFESWHCHIWKQKSNNKVMHINSHIFEWTKCFNFCIKLDQSQILYKSSFNSYTLVVCWAFDFNVLSSKILRQFLKLW